MKNPTKAVLGTAAAVTLAASTVLAGGVAGAQIPGAVNDGVVVITDSDLVQVAVNDKGENPSQVTGSITNTGDRQLRCATPGLNGAEHPGQVTEAAVVERAMNYYTNNIFEPGGFEIPMEGGVAFAGSLYDIMPTGSLAGSLLGDGTAELVEIRDMQEAARLAGRTGDPQVGNATAFTLTPGQTSDWVADLAVPGPGVDRGEWQAAAMFFCSHTSGNPLESFVFAGYEEIVDDEIIDDENDDENDDEPGEP